MANGLSHTTATLCASSGAIVYLASLGRYNESTAWLLAGLWCAVVQPDLDNLESPYGYYGYSVLDKTKDGLSELWRVLWMPYAWRIPHRSFWSHFPIIGTLIRLGYTLIALPLIYHFNGVDFLTGIIAMDTLHWMMDWKVWTRLGIFKQ